MKKLLFKISIILLLFCGYFVIQNFQQPPAVVIDLPVQTIQPELTVNFLDVGQGDSILIQTPEKMKILIDGGPDNTVINRLADVLPFWDNKIDIMILTHPHTDHLIGEVEILKRFDVGEIYYTGVNYRSADYSAWLKEIESQNIPSIIVSAGGGSAFGGNQNQTLSLGNNLTLDFLWPTKDFTNKKVDDLNSTSIVNKLTYGSVDFLLMGDATAEVETELLKENNNLQSEILKIGHHGSHFSSSLAFLNVVKPEVAIIPVGQDNKFNHPHLLTIRRLEKLAAKIFRTDLSGTITVTTDGKAYSVSTTRK